MSDNGRHPTGKALTKACATLGSTQALTSYNNPKGNAKTECLMRTLKQELILCPEVDESQKVAGRVSHLGAV